MGTPLAQVLIIPGILYASQGKGAIINPKPFRGEAAHTSARISSAFLGGVRDVRVRPQHWESCQNPLFPLDKCIFQKLWPFSFSFSFSAFFLFFFSFSFFLFSFCFPLSFPLSPLFPSLSSVAQAQSPGKTSRFTPCGLNASA